MQQQQARKLQRPQVQQVLIQQQPPQQVVQPLRLALLPRQRVQLQQQVQPQQRVQPQQQAQLLRHLMIHVCHIFSTDLIYLETII